MSRCSSARAPTARPLPASIDAIAKSNADSRDRPGAVKHPMRPVADSSDLAVPKMLGPILAGAGFIVLGLLAAHRRSRVAYRRRRPG